MPKKATIQVLLADSLHRLVEQKRILQLVRIEILAVSDLFVPLSFFLYVAFTNGWKV